MIGNYTYKKSRIIQVSTLLIYLTSACNATEPTTGLTLNPSEAFLINNITPTLSSELSAIGQDFLQGTADGLSSYVTASQSLINQILHGDFQTLQQESILALLHEQLPDVMAHALISDIDATTPEQRQLLIIEKIFPIIRRAVYQSLMETDNFGKKKEVYVAERQQIETHYKVSVGLASTFIRAILPDDSPLKHPLLSLAKYEKISNYILAKLDKHFIRQTAKLVHQITGDINPELFKNAETLWIIGLSGTPINQSMLFGQPTTNTLSSKKKETAFKNVWKYLKPRVNHHIRSGINRTLQNFATIAATKISPSIYTTAANTVKNHASGIRLLATGAGYYAGGFLSYPPVIGSAIVAGGAYWLTSGLLYSAIPNGLAQTTQKSEKLITQQIRLFADNYTNSFFPLTAEEHSLYQLNPNPSALETFLFADDYDLRNKLRSEKLTGSLLKDLAHLLKKPIPFLLSNDSPEIPLDMNNADEFDFIDRLGKPKPEAPSKTQIQLEFYRFAVAVEQHQQNIDLFNKSTSCLSWLISYLTGQKRERPELAPEYQANLNQLRTYPSYAMYQAQSNKDKVEAEITRLSQGYVAEARDILSKIDKAKQVMIAQSKNPDHIDHLAQSLSYDDYVQALDTLIADQIPAAAHQRTDKF